MAIPDDLLEKLCCPQCRGELDLVSGDDPEAEGLACRSCRLLYPIEDDIPVMMIDLARALPGEPA